MKRTILFAILMSACLSVPALALTPAHRWSERHGDAADQNGASLAADPAGNVYVAGYFQGEIDLGGGPLTSAGSTDVFLAKFSADGTHMWSKRFGDAAEQKGTAVATDAEGNVFVAGTFFGTIDCGGGVMASAGDSDIFLAKFDAAGAYRAGDRFGGTSTDVVTAIATDPTGEVTLTGHFLGSLNFGGYILVSAGGYDVFLARVDGVAIPIWAKRFGNSLTQYGYSVATDAAGNVFITGTFGGSMSFGGDTLTSGGGFDIFLAKFLPGGVHLWSTRFGTVGAQSGTAVVTDGAGDVYLAGNFAIRTNFGGGLLFSAGNDDMFLAKYSTDGLHQWSQRFGDTLQQSAQALSTDGDGHVYLTGYFQGEADFGSGPLVSAGAWDGFLAKFDPAGVNQWSGRFGDPVEQWVYDVAADASRNVFVTGRFLGSPDFGGGALTENGGGDVFVASFSQFSEEPVIQSITDIEADEGKQVRIEFARSGRDEAIADQVLTYEAYRAREATSSAAPAGFSRAALQDLGWDFVGSAPAHGGDSYAFVAPTLVDSTVAAGMHYTTFFIRASTAQPLTHFDSPTDSGYSVDNLAPGVPLHPVLGAGQLTWEDSPAPDFDFFTVYGSNSAWFGSATIIGYTVPPAMDVSASPYAFYFITATDFAGNEGTPVMVSLATGIGGAPDRYVLSISSYPNPFNPTTTIRYTVPSKGRVTVDVYDARGTRVAALVDEARAAGAYTEVWNGRDHSGKAVSSGVYFARITHAAGTKSYKLVLLK